MNFMMIYAHHPTEIFSIGGVKKISNEKKITTIFQPHRYSRVNLLKKNLQVLSNFVIG